MATMFCSNCGFQTDSGARFCQKCGTAMAAAPVEVTPGGYVPAAAYARPVFPPFAPRGYGGFWIRVVAAILDGILLNAVTVPLAFFFLWPALGADPDAMPFLGFTMWPVFFGIKLLYYAAMESSSHQATIGKLVCGLRVMDVNGGRLSFPHAAGRYLAKLLSSITLGIGYIMAGFTERKQGLHDMVAGTLVVKR